MTATDPFELLRAHVRALPEVVPRVADDELINQIVGGTYVPTIDELAIRRHRRRRRGLFLGVAIGVAASGGIVAANLTRHEKPQYPEVGAVCYDAFSESANRMQVDGSTDPLGACTAAWANGSISAMMGNEPPAVVPPLIVCINSGGALAVFPAEHGEQCIDLGLPGAVVPDEVDPLITLQERLTAEVNAECLSLDDATAKSRAILDDMGLSDWRVVMSEGRGPCFGASASRDDTSVHIARFTPNP